MPFFLNFRRKILIAAFIEGFCVVGLEIVINNILFLYYGNSHFVWAFILGFSMLALALGYLASNFLSGKKNAKKIIQNLFTLAAVVYAISITFSNQFLLKLHFENLYLSLGITSVFLIFFPVFFLGCLSFYLLKQLQIIDNLSILSSIGKTLGNSSFGALLASLIFSYYLIPELGLLLCAFLIILLLLTGAFMFYDPQNKKTIILSTIVIVIIGAKAYSRVNKTSGSTFSIKYESNNILGQLRVLDNYPKGKNFGTRRLLINNIPQTFIINNSDAYSFWNYTHYVSGFATLKDTTSKVLLVGLGGGSLARELKKQNFKFDIVEIDRRIIDISTKYFYLSFNDNLIINEDVRTYLKGTNKLYDLIVYDVLSGEVQPNHVFSYEALQELKLKLSKKAVVIINFQGILNEKKDKAFSTLMNTFKKAGFYPYYWAPNPDGFDDIVFCISPSPIDFSKIDKSRLNECCDASPIMPEFLKYDFAKSSFSYDSTIYLSDDKPRLDMINTQAMLKWRKIMREEIIDPQIKEGLSVFK